MVITHVNRKQKTYYLHQGTTKSGNPKYFFSMKDDGNLVEAIPDGYEIYENPNAQVFLRKISAKVITDDERAVVETGMQQFTQIQHFQIDIKKDTISIFTPNQDVDAISELFTSTAFSETLAERRIQKFLAESSSYSSDLRFVLVDKQERLFKAQRYCYLGSVDDWVQVGSVNRLDKLVETYVKHLGQESFYDLF